VSFTLGSPGKLTPKKSFRLWYSNHPCAKEGTEINSINPIVSEITCIVDPPHAYNRYLMMSPTENADNSTPPYPATSSSLANGANGAAHIGPALVSCVQSVISSADRDLTARRLRELEHRYRPLAADWESGAIAWVANRNKVPLLSLRGVSDLARCRMSHFS
jgi:hypothetical protein